MERRFACTACGRCCHGWLPLTLDEAVLHAGRFPLGLVWTPVRQGHKAFTITARLGTTVRLRDKRQLAVRVVPMAYLPPAMACPALSADGRCAIHATKPARCRAMPFFAYRDEAEQAENLVLRPGWECDGSAAAPVVYRDKRIVERSDFDRERAALLAQAPLLKAYADRQVTSVPNLVEALVKASLKPVGGDVLLSFATLAPDLKAWDWGALARAQLAVLADFAARTEGEYRQRYGEWTRDMERLERRAASAIPPGSSA